MTQTQSKKMPQLRFPKFKRAYQKKNIGSITQRVVNPVSLKNGVEYTEIGIKSHGKGIFYKPPTTSLDIGDKRVFWVEADLFIVNIVFAWEQAVAITSKNDVGKIASHRFPMYRASNGKMTTGYLHRFFQTQRGKSLLGIASPGGAGRNKTLGQKEFEKLKIYIPDVLEQQRIADFIFAIDKKINLLSQKYEQLIEYKKGVTKKLLDQKVRFSTDSGQQYPAWQLKRLSELLDEHKKRNRDLVYGKENVLSVSGKSGIVNQIEHLGRSYAGVSVKDYHVVHEGDIVYTKSPLKANPYGIIKSNKGPAGIVSTLYAVYSCKEGTNHEFIEYYFGIDDNLNRYLRPLVHKGAKNDMKINNQRVLIDKISIPSQKEQDKIVTFLKEVDKKVFLAKQQLEQTEAYKQGLLQQMFV